MFKKALSFVKIYFVFLFLFSGSSFFVFNELVDLSHTNLTSNRVQTFVSTKDEFVQAARAKEDIILQANIDFSSATVDDYLIAGYDGTIEGNGYALTNGLIVEDPDEHHFFYYLFNDFKGKVSNLVLDNFPFFARTMKDETSIQTADGPDIFNITMRNINIKNFSISKNIVTSDGSADGVSNATSLYMGFFAEQIKNYWLSDFSITNCSINDNNFEMIKNTTDRIDFYAGYIIGNNDSGKLEKTFMINNSFVNNTIKHALVSGENSGGVIEIGTLMGRSNDAEVIDNFVNNYNMSNNSFVAGFMRWGALVGYANGIKIFTSYVSNITFHDNNVAITTTDKLVFSGGIGGVNPSFNYGINKLVISETDFDNNFVTPTGGSAQEVAPSEIGGDGMGTVLDNQQSGYQNYFVGSSTTNFNTIIVIDFSQLTSDYWANTIGFSPLIWNLENLVDANMQITQADEPGYPIFKKLSYFNTSIVDDGTSFVIDEKNIVSGSVSGIRLKSSFGDDIDINANGANQIDLGINSGWLANRTDEQKLDFFNNNFWFELESTTLDEPIISGNFSNLQSRNYEAPNIEIMSNSVTSSDENYQEFTFTRNVSGEQFITNNLSDYDTFSIESNADFLNMNFTDQNLFQVPNYISDLNSYFKINIPNTEFSYISESKTLETKNVLANGVFTNVSETPLALEKPHILINSTFDATNKQIKVNLKMDSNSSLFAYDATDWTNTNLTIHSTFAEFDGNNSKVISLDEFAPDVSGISTTIDLQSSVPQEYLDSFYALEFTSNLKYYNDLAYGTDLISDYTFEGDLTNNDPSMVLPYDDTEAFDGLITSELTLDNKIKINFSEDFLYMFNYEINLIIESENTINNISFTPTSPNEVTIEIDSMLIKYYESLEAGEQSSFDINEYYSISIDDTKTNEISYLNNVGEVETTTIDEWVASRANNQLGISGLITNTSGTISSIPIVSRPVLPPVEPPTVRPVVPPVEPPTVTPIPPEIEVSFRLFYAIIIGILLIIVLLIIARMLIFLFKPKAKPDITIK